MEALPRRSTSMQFAGLAKSAAYSSCSLRDSKSGKEFHPSKYSKPLVLH
jgi:hypothetical protein